MALFVLQSCKPLLLYDDLYPKFRGTEEKACCVIIRPSGVAGEEFYPVWVDTQLVSGTTGKTITSFPVDPGEHFIIVKSDTTARVKLLFEAGKEYYLGIHAASISVPDSSILLRPVTCSEAGYHLEVSWYSLKYSRLNPEKQLRNLSAEELTQERSAWEKWAKENPEKVKKETEYAGCVY